MKKNLKALFVLACAAFCLTVAFLPAAAQAQWVSVATIAQAETKEGVPTVSVYQLPSNVPEVVCAWMVMGSKGGDKISGAFIAADVGDAAPKNYLIDTAVYTLPTSSSNTAWGQFKLSSPKNGWPPGFYRVEVKKNDVLVAVAHFEIRR